MAAEVDGSVNAALYNEIESYAVRWMENLIDARHIAPGRVESRSITDLTPDDVRSATQFHAFAGIGVWSAALRDAGWPDDCPAWTGSCPCQPFSDAGRRKGFADDRHLWPAWHRLIDDCRPPVVFGEQVASADGRTWLDAVCADLEGSGYAVRPFDLPACGVGAPHRRSRHYFVALADGERLEGVRVQLLAGRSRSAGTEAGRGGEVGGRGRALPNASGEGLEIIGEQQDRNECATAQRNREADHARGVVDAERDRRGSGRVDSSHGRPTIESDRSGETDATAARHGLGDPRALPRTQGDRESERIRIGDLADESFLASTAHGERVRFADDPTWGGAVKGFWADDIEWIRCRPEPAYPDGRWRPVASGIEPLAHGATAGVGRNRTARLKGYGNAITRQVASTFIEAVIDVLCDP